MHVPASFLGTQLERVELEAKNTVKAKYKLILPPEKFAKIDKWLNTKFDKPLSVALPSLTDHKTRFVICSTDCNIGGPFYFTQNWIGPHLEDEAVDRTRTLPYNHCDYKKLQEITYSKDFHLSHAIAASAAFPAFLPLEFAVPRKGNS